MLLTFSKRPRSIGTILLRCNILIYKLLSKIIVYRDEDFEGVIAMKTRKPTKKAKSRRTAQTWHGIDFHHPIHSLQNSHPGVFVAFLLGLYVTYIITFVGIADLVGMR